MSPQPRSGIPLHIQILIALVLGTGIGVALNPGAVRLPDEPVTVSVAVRTEISDSHPAGEWIAKVDDPSGWESITRRFPADDQFRLAYPGLDASVETIPGGPAVTAIVQVTDRAVQLTEIPGSITIEYTRRHDGRAVSSTVKASRPQDLPAHWKAFQETHGGGWKRAVAAAARYGGDLFLRLLKMITVPLILTSLITGVAGLDSGSRFGRLFSRTLFYYLGTSLLAVVTGIAMVNLIRPGINADLPGGTEAVLAGSGQSMTGILLGLVEGMIPTNPFSSLAEANFLSIITFSIVFGVFIIRVGGRSAQVLRDFFQAAFDVIMQLTMAIIRLAPLGVFCFMVFATASQGLAIFGTLAWYMLAVFAGLLVHAAVTLPLILKFVARRSPLEYLRAVSPALMTAFSTASSNGTLPLTMTCVEERAGISNRVSSFVLPLGATVNMDGTALYEVVAVLFIAQAYHGDVPLAQQIVVAITALLASVGAAGIPHAGLVMMAIVLQAVNLPLEAQGIIIAVDRVLDMCRTTVNVWSDACGCAVVAGMDSDAAADPPPAGQAVHA